jgi:hypothetical protein
VRGGKGAKVTKPPSLAQAGECSFPYDDMTVMRLLPALLACLLAASIAEAADEPLIELRVPPRARRAAAEAPAARVAEAGDFVPAYDLAPPVEALTFATMHEVLDPVGSWVEVPPHGLVWRPDRERVGKDFAPYREGRWVQTPRGWSWSSADAWGWIPAHYGRWRRIAEHGWVWIPGLVWAPAYVRWRMLEDGVAWVPLDATETDEMVAVAHRDFLARNIARVRRIPARGNGAALEPGTPGVTVEGPSTALIAGATGEAVPLFVPPAAPPEEAMMIYSTGGAAIFVRPRGGGAPASPGVPQQPGGGSFAETPATFPDRPIIVVPQQPAPAPGRPFTPQAPIGGGAGTITPQAPITPMQPFGGGAGTITPQAPIRPQGR